MRALVTWFFALALFAASCAGCSHVAPPKAAQRLTFAEQLQRESVALVNADDDDSKVAVPYCTGIWVDKTHILTAGHCVEPDMPDELKKLFPDGVNIKISPMNRKVLYATYDDMDHGDMLSADKARPALVTAYDPSIDLALIEAPTAGSHPVVDLNASDPHPGDTLHLVGHTVTLPWTYMEGPVSMLRFTDAGHEYPRKVHLVQASVPAWSGDSGGGAFDDQGHLVGIALFVFKRGPNLSFFIGRQEIDGFLVSNHVAVP